MNDADIDREAKIIALSDAIGPHTKRNTLHAMIMSLVHQAVAEERAKCADRALAMMKRLNTDFRLEIAELIRNGGDR